MGIQIEYALRHLCELLDTDLAIFWQWSQAAPDVITPTQSHFTGEGPRPSEPMRQNLYPWTRSQLLAGRLVAVSSLERLPAEADVYRETCLRFGIKSAIALPLAVGGEPPLGALGLNCLRAERGWPDALVKRLQLVAQIFANALARQRHEQQLYLHLGRKDPGPGDRAGAKSWREVARSYSMVVLRSERDHIGED